MVELATCGEPCGEAWLAVDACGNKWRFPGFVPERGALMPPWVELLLNVIAFAGFIAIAKYHKSRGGNLPDR